MIRSNSQHLVSELLNGFSSFLLPKQPYLAAVRNISDRVGAVEAMFDQFGRVRTLTAVSGNGLFDQTPGSTDSIESFAEKFIASDEIVKAFGLRHVDLELTDSVELPGLGTRVEFRQIVKLDDATHPVRGGFVHVFIDEQKHVYQVNSTVRFGRRPSGSASFITVDEAIAAARKSISVDSTASERVEFMYSSHNEKMNPVFEVTLVTNEPRRVVKVLVMATTGEVVNIANKLHAHGGRIRLEPSRKSRRRRNQKAADDTSTGAPAKDPVGKVFFAIPDPKQPIPAQIHDAIIDGLPDKSVLKNENCIIYLGSKKTEVRAKADGSFQYSPSDPQFSAVVTYFAFQQQMALFKSWGMLAPERPILVFVDDPNVSDNAYFDPENYEIHLGVGSGAPMGLAKKISYDLGVTWHENGHHVVYLQCPGKDLPGSEGGGIHESIGDVLGDLLMDFWFRLKYAKELGKPLTAKEVEADTRVIGKYALPPNGIRIQKNTKKTPKDKTGEPHDDGLISGGAKADLLVAMATVPGADLAKAFENFGRMTLAALALVPSHKVTFQDLLRAYLTADKKLFNEANKALIVKAFGDHGITLKAGSDGVQPLTLMRFGA